jgi:hypothetical protein
MLEFGCSNKGDSQILLLYELVDCWTAILRGLSILPRRFTATGKTGKVYLSPHAPPTDSLCGSE